MLSLITCVKCGSKRVRYKRTSVSRSVCGVTLGMPQVPSPPGPCFCISDHPYLSQRLPQGLQKGYFLFYCSFYIYEVAFALNNIPLSSGNELRFLPRKNPWLLSDTRNGRRKTLTCLDLGSLIWLKSNMGGEMMKCALHLFPESVLFLGNGT